MRPGGIGCALTIILMASAVQAGPLSDAKVDLSAYASQQLRAGQDADVAVALAISGGGLRAGNFGLGVMLGLEAVGTTHGDLLAEVDYISTASGGGFPAAVWIASRHDHDPAQGPYSLATVVVEGGPQRAVLRGGYTGRMFNVGCEVFRASRDRGHSLEKLVDDGPLGAAARGTSLTLGDVWRRTGAPRRQLSTLQHDKRVGGVGLKTSGEARAFICNRHTGQILPRLG